MWARLMCGLGAFAPIVTAVGLGCVIAYGLIVDGLESGSLTGGDPIEALESGPFDATAWALFGIVVVGIALLELVLTTVFAVHAARVAHLSNVATLGWLLAFLLVGPFALPLYFVLYVARDRARRVTLPDFP